VFLGIFFLLPNVSNAALSGDFNNDGVVSIAEVQTCINSFLGIIPNNAPVSNAGSSQNVFLGAIVTLDGSASSDPNGDPLTYNWAFTSKPAGSNVTISKATDIKPIFTPDVIGTYILSLIVNDGKINSTASTITITVSQITCNSPQRCPVRFVHSSLRIKN
jgi:hypothetical protein